MMNGVDGLLNTIQCGDSTLILKTIPDNSIDLVITSPPYYMQRDYNEMGIGTGHESAVDKYIDSLLETFEEVIRILKSTGNIIYNIGDKYMGSSLLLVPYRFAISATKRYPVRLINDITWVKRNPTPRQFTRRLVSGTEPFFHFAKGPDYYYDLENFLRCEGENKRPAPSNRMGEKYRSLIEQSNLSVLQKRKANESLDDAIQQVMRGDIQSFRMKIKGIHAEAFGGQGGGRKSQMDKNGFTVIRIHGKKMKKDVIDSPVESIPGMRHTAIFPLSIIRELVKLLSPPRGIVLDPYVGSGTTAVAALEEGRKYIGTDIDSHYCGLALERIERCKEKGAC